MIDLKSLINPIEHIFINQLFDQFAANDQELRIVGGFIRDAMLKQDSNALESDIDFSTTATPSEVKNIVKSIADIDILPIPGEVFGTIFIFSKNTGKKYEITSCRLDVKTFGRHAEVEFCRSFEQDSLRRDFTINALYCDQNGKIYDFHNGLEDIKNKKVQFIGSPNQRIMEDYLRILRYFRFCGIIGNFDNNTMFVCYKLAEKKKKISIERIMDEIGKNLSINNTEALFKLQKNHILEYITPRFNMAKLHSMIAIEKDLSEIHDIDIKDLKTVALFYEGENFIKRHLTKKQRSIYDLSKKNWGKTPWEILSNSPNKRSGYCNIIFNSADISQALIDFKFLSSLDFKTLANPNLKGSAIKQDILQQRLNFYQQEFNKLHQK